MQVLWTEDCRHLGIIDYLRLTQKNPPQDVMVNIKGESVLHPFPVSSISVHRRVR